MTPIIVADEYHGDGFRTDYAAYGKASRFIWQKADESESSPENEDWYEIASRRAKAAGVQSGAYTYGRIDSDGRDDCRALLRAAPNADAYAVDVEAHFNETVPPSVVIAWCNQFEDEFYNLVQDKPLVAYGRSYFVAKRVRWTACFKHILTLGWVPRYNGSTLNPANMGDTMADFGLPREKVALWQFTNGTDGPSPHTLAGLNRNEDLSLLLVPLERITGGTGGEPDMTPAEVKQLIQDWWTQADGPKDRLDRVVRMADDAGQYIAGVNEFQAGNPLDPDPTHPWSVQKKAGWTDARFFATNPQVPAGGASKTHIHGEGVTGPPREPTP